MKKICYGFLFLIELCAFPGHAQLVGELWGVTHYGGQDGMGIIFKTAPDGTNMSVQHSFSATNKGGYPVSGLVEASDGKMYGMTSGGGVHNQGVLFSFNPSSKTYTSLLDFDMVTTGGYPQGNLLQLPNGKLYGLTAGGGMYNRGVLFEYDPASNSFTRDVDFSLESGASPYGSLALADNGKLYGMTYYGGDNIFGVLFDFDPATKTYHVDFSFNGSSNGKYPNGGLVKASNGKLYGMTQAGGTNDAGVIFDFDPSSNTYHKDIDLDASTTGTVPMGSLIQATNGKLYGLTRDGGVNNQGALFSFDPVTSAYVTKVSFDLTNGGHPNGNLLQTSNGKLYGLTAYGGSLYRGSLFEFDPSSDSYSRVLDFDGLNNGAIPFGTLIQTSNGKLYGVTTQGGANNQGVIFDYDLTTTTYTKEIDFNNAQAGSDPYGGLTQVSNELYGVTYSGGAFSFGTIFKFDPATGTYNKLFDFNGAISGAYPQGQLVLASNNKLYGIASSGGANNLGLLFQFDPVTGTYIKEFDFDASSSGGNPQGSLIQATNGKLYGLTNAYGSNGGGTIFEFDPATHVFLKKMDFQGTIGSGPHGSLVQAPNGKLYGLTEFGGNDNWGVLFEYDLQTNIYTKKYDFDLTTGANQIGSLVVAPGGKLYGMTSNSGTINSILFEFDPASGIYAVDQSFVGYLDGSLTVGTNGKLYGVTTWEGSPDKQGLFEFNPADKSLSHKFYFTGPNGLNDNYGQLLVWSGTQTINFTLTSKNYGTAPFSLNATSSSGLPITYTISDTTVARITGNTLTILKPGTTTITAHQAGSAGFSPAPDVAQILVVHKGTQTITFNTLPSKTYGDTSFPLAAKASSGLAVTYVSSDPTVAKISGDTAVTILKGGTSMITARQGGNSNYDSAVSVTHSLTVNKVSQTITFNALPAKTYGDAPFTLTAKASSGLAVSFVSADPTVAKISSDTVVTILKGGLTTITASQSGNSNYDSAASVTKTLAVNKVSQTITFANLGTKTVGDSTFSLTASASSGLGITFSSGSGAVAISGHQVTIINAGRDTITAYQPGNSFFSAAAPVSESFCINPAKPTITFSSSDPGRPTLTSSASSGNQWYFNGLAIAGAADSLIIINMAGIYAVQVKADDCISDLSENYVLAVTELSYLTEPLSLFPNPSHDFVVLRGVTHEVSYSSIIDVLGQATTVQLQKQPDGHSADISNLSTGLYIMKISEGDVVHQIKFVKN